MFCAKFNVVFQGTNTYTYDNTNRLASITTSSGTDTYQYNGLGQRIEKTVGSTTTVFVYDEAGHLIGEYTPSGSLIAEHIWLNNRPIGVITSTGLYYVHTDQLGTPRVITNSSKAIVWQWHSDPFGNGAPTGSLTYNLRFPGQYYDSETGHNYNYFRYYDPTIGRFISSDPIGLRGGINTYAYVMNNPIDLADPLGLCPTCSSPPPFPPGENVDTNIALAQNVHTNSELFLGPLNAQIVQLGFLANMELPGQSWDYNNRFGNQYDAAGNFNFGAVSAAMGYSNYFILNAGGVLKEGEFLSQGKLDLNGIPFFEYPYGNQALKQAMVQAGIDYYLCNYQ